MRGLILSIVVMFSFCKHVYASDVGLIYIQCDLQTKTALINMNYYLDDIHKKVLNDSKSEFGQTRDWSAEKITIASSGESGVFIIVFNRLTGEITAYIEGRWFETISVGACKKAQQPTRKF